MKFLSRITPWQLAGLMALVALAIVPRFYHLGARPLMHDESQDCYFSYNIFRGQHYTFSAILHGPLIQLSTGLLAFKAFGDSVSTARGYVALCSLLVLVLMIALAPRRSRWWVALLLILSPELLYYSRFYRAEMIFNAWFMLGMLGMVKCLTPTDRGASYYIVWSALATFALVSLLAIKINAIFVYATGLTFLVLWWIIRNYWRGAALGLRLNIDPEVEAARAARRRRPRVIKGAASKRGHRNHIIAPLTGWPTWVGWGLGAILGTALVLIVYGYTGPDEKVFAPFLNLGKMWDYWFGQHETQRISGPLHFHLPILLTYEMPLVILLLVGIVLDACRSYWRTSVYGLAILGWYALWQIWNWSTPPLNPSAPPLTGAQKGIITKVLDLLHLAPNNSVLVLGLVIVPLLVWSVLMLKEHRPLAAWMAWWGACSLFQYSSAGEKVPWLGEYFVMPFYLTAAWMWAPRLRHLKMPGRTAFATCITLAAGLMAWIDLPLITTREANPIEVLVYNHTTPEFHSFCEGLLAKWEADKENIPLEKREVLLSGAPEWPGYWYFRHCHTVFGQTANPNTDLMLGEKMTIDPALETANASGEASWIKGTLNLRQAWISDWPKAENRVPTNDPLVTIVDPRSTVRKWWDYYWHRTTWGWQPGGFDIEYIIPKEIRHETK